MTRGDRREVIEARGLEKRFGEVTALRDATLTVRSPGLTGILGPNGAGKTTLLDILEGLADPSGGSFRLFGDAPTPYPRRRVGIVMQKEVSLERVTTGEYAELFAAIYAIRGGADRVLARARLHDRAGVPMARLSGGESARLFVATALIHDPELVFLDEPTAHLDPESKREIGELLAEVARTRAVVLCTHDLREADELCDDLVFLVGGRVRASGSRADLLAAAAREGGAGARVEDAFFHFCAIRMRDGEIEEAT